MNRKATRLLSDLAAAIVALEDDNDELEKANESLESDLEKASVTIERLDVRVWKLESELQEERRQIARDID